MANDLGTRSGHDSAPPPGSALPEPPAGRPEPLSTFLDRIRAHFAPPAFALPVHVAQRQARRCDACLRLIEHLFQPDGALRLDGLHPGALGRVLKLKFKHVVQALRDLVEIGLVEGYAVPVRSGNRCGHRPDRPRWFQPPEWHRPHPRIIERIITAVRAYYQAPSATLPVLNAVNGSRRQQRSERREACVAMLATLLHYTDLTTLRVGRPQPDGSFAGVPMDELAGIAGLARLQPDGSVCIRRAERALADLKSAGIVTVHAVCERLEDCTYRGYAAIRTVTRHLFTAFGLDRWLEHERRRSRERRDKKQRKPQRKNLAHVQMAVGASRTPAAKPAAQPASAPRQGPLAHISELLAGLRATLATGPP